MPCAWPQPEVLSISKNTYTKREMLQWEMRILVGLEWKLLSPSAHEMASEMLRLIRYNKNQPRDKVAIALNSFVGVGLDLAMFDEYFLRFSTPTIALAATMVAFRATGAEKQLRSYLLKIGRVLDPYVRQPRRL